MNTYRLLGLLMFLSLLGCRETFVTGGEDEIVDLLNLSVELISDQDVSATVNRSISFGSDASKSYLSDAEIMLTGSNLDAERLKLEYDPNEKNYKLGRRTARITEGHHYNIEIHSPHSAGEVITASTYIPRAVAAKRYELDWTIDQDNSGSKMYDIDLKVALNEPLDLPAYYHIVPYRKLAEEYIDVRGNTGITEFAKRIELEVVDVVINKNAVNTLIHKEGLIVDQSRLAGDELHLTLRTPEPLSAREVITKLELDIFTLSEDLYKYHQSLDRQILNARADYSSITPSYSNVVNAQGIFGGCSLKTLIMSK